MLLLLAFSSAWILSCSAVILRVLLVSLRALPSYEVISDDFRDFLQVKNATLPEVGQPYRGDIKRRVGPSYAPLCYACCDCNKLIFFTRTSFEFTP